MERKTHGKLIGYVTIPVKFRLTSNVFLKKFLCNELSTRVRVRTTQELAKAGLRGLASVSCGLAFVRFAPPGKAEVHDGWVRGQGGRAHRRGARAVSVSFGKS